MERGSHSASYRQGRQGWSSPSRRTRSRRALEETLGAGWAPVWSPDGSTIALIRSGGEGDEVWTIDLDSGSEVQLAAGLGSSLEPDLAWAPDGTALLVADGEWIYRVNATLGGDPRDDFERLVEGQSPAWQPLPVESEPSVTTSPESEGREIGLGFPICNAERLDGIDWYGDGTLGAAWTGARATDGGSCPASDEGEYTLRRTSTATGQPNRVAWVSWSTASSVTRSPRRT